MAFGFDGTIRIDSSIDPKGFNQGVDKLKASAAKAARAIGRSFGGVGKAIGLVTRAVGTAALALLYLSALVFGQLALVVALSLREFFKLEDSVTDLKNSLRDLRNAFAIAFAPLVTFAIPYIQAAISWLIRLLNTIAMIVGALLGQRQVWQAVEGGAAKAAAATGKMADNTEKARKAARGALAAFDQINVLNRPEEQLPDLGGAGGGGAGGLGGPGFELVPIGEDILDRVGKFKEAFLDFIEPLLEAFGRLKEKAQPLLETLGSILLWLWEHVLVPLGTWIVQQLIPALIDLFGEWLVIANDVLLALQPAAEWFWEEFLKPAAEWTGQALIDGLKWLTERLRELHEWIENNQETFQLIVNTILIAIAVFLILNTTVGAVIAIILGLIWVLRHAGEAWETLKDLASLAWLIIKAVWGLAAEWFRAHVIDPIKQGFDKMLDSLRAGWERAWNGIKGFVRGTINSIIDFINGMIQAIIRGINAVISALNGIRVSIPSWVPGFGGNAFALNIPAVSAPRIPRLATGAVIPPNAEFAAILGDQRGGKNLEAPAAMFEEMLQRAVAGAGQNQEIVIRFEGSLAALVRELKPVIDAENARIGGSLIRSGATAR